MSSSPFIKHGRNPSSLAAASPARGGILTFPGNHSSPSTSQHNVPSPATFANMAAAVGVQNPLEDTTSRAGESNTGIGQGKVLDPYADLLANVDNFLNVQLAQLETAGHLFFDQYQGALHETSDSGKVVDAHRNLLCVYDQLISTCAQLGLAALPCPALEPSSTIKPPSLDEMHNKLSNETKDTFERRERLREGSSIVTSILTQQFQPSR